MDLGIKDKIALVCGASKGLGKAVALGLAKEGARAGCLFPEQRKYFNGRDRNF